MNKLCSIFSVFFAFFMVIGMSQASDLKPLPEPEKGSYKAFFVSSEENVSENEQDPAVSYKIRIPKGWTEIAPERLKNYTLHEKLFGDIALFQSPVHSQGRARIEIESHELTHELYLNHWLIKRILDKGYTLRSIKEMENRKVEATYVIFVDNVTYIAHTVAQVNGPRVVQATFLTPADRYKELRDTQIHTVRSFSLMVRDNFSPEELKTYAYLDLSKFDYPESLVLRSSDIVSDERLELSLVSQDANGFIKGGLDFYIYAQNEEFNLKEKIEEIIAGYETQRLVVKDKIENKSYQFSDFIDFQSTEVYGVSLKGSDYIRYAEDPITQELWLAILGDGEFFYILSMMGVSRDIDIYNWSRNARALEIVLTSLRR